MNDTESGKYVQWSAMSGAVWRGGVICIDLKVATQDGFLPDEIMSWKEEEEAQGVRARNTCRISSELSSTKPSPLKKDFCMVKLGQGTYVLSGLLFLGLKYQWIYYYFF